MFLKIIGAYLSGVHATWKPFLIHDTPQRMEDHILILLLIKAVRNDVDVFRKQDIAIVWKHCTCL